MPAAQQAGTAPQAQKRKQDARRKPLAAAQRERPVQLRVQVRARDDAEIRAGAVRHLQMIDGGLQPHHCSTDAA